MSPINIQSISIFHQIDTFVKTILRKILNLETVNLVEVTNQLNQFSQPFFSIYDADYCYSNTIHAFVGASHACMSGIEPQNFYWQISSTQQFLYHLLSYEPFIRYSIQSQINQELNNQRELESYARKVLGKYAKSLVIFVTLDYQLEHRTKVSLEDFQAHMENLRDLISNKKTCFKDLVGYAWAIEQGVDKGHHCHLWLTYDGSKRQADFHIGREVGEKWIKITNGLGAYHNSNNPETKTAYQQLGRLGIGRIHRNFQNEIENAVTTALYLAKPSKEDQYVVIKPSGMRTFGKGQIK